MARLVGIDMTSNKEEDRVNVTEPEQTDNRSEGAVASLTSREIEVAALLVQGMSNKEIAETLGIELGTVRTHLSNLFRKLNVHTRYKAGEAFARLSKVSDEQLRRIIDGTLSISRLLCQEPPREFAKGTVLFRKGEITDALYYVVHGVVSLDELDIDRGPGELIGEIGLFSSEQRRMASARCKTDCVLRKLTAKDAMRIYIKDPEFAIHVTQLLTRRLLGGK
jgi:DNA-binding CsgD family transcriptional regulator